MTLKIDRFGGIAPRFHPSLLSDGMAVTAHNCRLKNGKLVPLLRPVEADGIEAYFENGLVDAAGAMSMHIWREVDGSFALLLFPGVTWAASGNVADDRFTRLIVSGETGRSFNGVNDTPVLYVREDGTRGKSTAVIAKNPLVAPFVRRVSAGALDDNRRYARFFATWVDRLDMESPPSAASRLSDGSDATLEYMDGDTVAVRFPEGIPSSATLVRIYKSITGSETGYVQFIKEFPASSFAGGAEVQIAEKDENAGEEMPEIESPFADLTCIQNVPGSFYVGFSPTSPKTVCFSEVDMLYSWPVAYRYDISDNIVAIAVTSNTVFALTDGWPYVLSGTAPESMTVAKIAGPAACVSARSVTVYGNAVFFASNIGLMSIYNDADAGTVCKNITESIFTKEQWQALNPGSCLISQNDGALFLFFTLEDGTTRRNFIIDISERAPVVTTHDVPANCLAVDSGKGDLYFVSAYRG